RIDMLCVEVRTHAQRYQSALFQRPRPRKRFSPCPLYNFSSVICDDKQTVSTFDSSGAIGAIRIHNHKRLVRALSEKRLRVRKFQRPFKFPRLELRRLAAETDGLAVAGKQGEEKHPPSVDLFIPYNAGISHNHRADAERLRIATQSEAHSFPRSRYRESLNGLHKTFDCNTHE